MKIVIVSLAVVFSVILSILTLYFVFNGMANNELKGILKDEPIRTTSMPDKELEDYPMPSDDWVNTYAGDYLGAFMGGCMGNTNWKATDINAMCCYCMGAKTFYYTTPTERADPSFDNSTKANGIIASCSYLYNK